MLDYHTAPPLSTLFSLFFHLCKQAVFHKQSLFLFLVGIGRLHKRNPLFWCTSWQNRLFTFAPQSSKVSATKFNGNEGHPVRRWETLPQRAAGGARPRSDSAPITVRSRAPKLMEVVGGDECARYSAADITPLTGRNRPSDGSNGCIPRGRAGGKLRWYHESSSSSVSLMGRRGRFYFRFWEETS